MPPHLQLLCVGAGLVGSKGQLPCYRGERAIQRLPPRGQGLVQEGGAVEVQAVKGVHQDGDLDLRQRHLLARARGQHLEGRRQQAQSAVHIQAGRDADAIQACTQACAQMMIPMHTNQQGK
jgi:hypothetical protein